MPDKARPKSNPDPVALLRHAKRELARAKQLPPSTRKLLREVAKTLENLIAAAVATLDVPEPAEFESRVRRRTAELSESNRLLAAMIDRRERMEQALRESEAQTRAILDTAVDAIITISDRGIISTFNRAAEKLFGYDSDEVIGRNVSLLMPEPYASEHDQYIAQYVKSRIPQIIGIGREVLGRRKDGSLFPLDLAVSEVRFGNTIAFTGIVRDLTERKRMENEVMEVAEREQRRIGQDLHDGLSQQLAGIGFLASTLEHRLGKESHSASADAQQISDLLRDAIAQARGLARGLYPVEPQPNGLPHALRQLCQNVHDAYKIDCRFMCKKIPPPEFGDRTTLTHLYRIAQEAVGNAVRHGQAKRVEVTLMDGRGTLTLRIRDYGIGLKEGVSDSGAPPEGIGMRTMTHRAHLMVVRYWSSLADPAWKSLAACRNGFAVAKVHHSRNTLKRRSHGNLQEIRRE